MTAEQWRLAEDILRACHMLDGTAYTANDVERLARNIAVRSWVERKLCEVAKTMKGERHGQCD